MQQQRNQHQIDLEVREEQEEEQMSILKEKNKRENKKSLDRIMKHRLMIADQRLKIISIQSQKSIQKQQLYNLIAASVQVDYIENYRIE